jgi:hypothetical protein
MKWGSIPGDISEDDLGADTVQFYSGDYGDLAYRPQLQIQYYVP